MQQRYMDPIAGRFLSVDPITTSADNGSMFNRYEYAQNNPYRYVDPDGRCTGSNIKTSDGQCPGGGFIAGGHSGGSTHYGGSGGGGAGTRAPAPAGAANAPGGPQIEPTWEEIGSVADGVSTAASITPIGMPLRAGKGLTVLYRAVSQAELKQIQRTGTFQAGPNSLGGKWLAERADHARKWGDALNGKGKSAILEVQLPKAQANQLMRLEKLDGIGPARYGNIEQLRGAIIKEVR